MLARFTAANLVVDSRNRILVVDRTENRVAVYDSAGAHITWWGKKGLGPGEFSSPYGIVLAPNGDVRVYDGVKESTLVFGPDGQVLSEESDHGRSSVDYMFPGGGSLRLRYKRDTTILSYAYHSDTTRLVTIVPRGTKQTGPVCHVTDYPAEPIFSPRILWAARDSIVATATDSFAITLYVQGKSVRVLRRSVPLRRATRALAERQLGKGPVLELHGMPPCTVPASMILAIADIADHTPAYSALAFAPDHTIWATRFIVPGESASADIYDQETGYLGTLALGSARPVAFMRDGRVISIENDRDDVPQIAVYAIRR
jgi:hypothetical protein